MTVHSREGLKTWWDGGKVYEGGERSMPGIYSVWSKFWIGYGMGSNEHCS